ncbi:MAG: endonuclease domain-containing protein [Xanthobacteraceae bacterium]
MIENGSAASPSPLPERGRSTREAGRVGVGATKFNRTPTKTKRARELRAAGTDVEVRLWQRLRRRALGADFRRQHPAGPYVLDFYCASLGLAIELDGSQHAEAAALAKDVERTRWLSKHGVSVLRFWNSDVNENLPGVLEAIVAEIARQRHLRMTPTRRAPPGLRWRRKLGGDRADLPLAGGGSELPER